MARRPKPIPYILIDPATNPAMYERLYMLVDELHPELSAVNVRIAMAWATAWKADPDGRVMLGKCKRATDLDRELAPFDFVILLSRSFWENEHVTDIQRKALLDHELMHAAVACDDNGEVRVDERGRTMFRIRKHDLEEFSDIAARYGCWKRDIESFAQALERAERGTAGWIGFAGLRDALQTVGLTVPIEAIGTWPAPERREAMTWALLRAEAQAQSPLSVSVGSMPACVAAAVLAPTVAPPAEVE